ncbi:hypothetical protein [Hymenobacter cellulosivorans]|uniref:Uncharacterized protein n=1 Tax=Hymenobacter cellulosivorans TaxID=2932249 RepID=A0ABY4F5K1_9BACT|nr:hypothetical protein [Hymenobacter cellulosivorans]UOQ51754.1 hypothetical protein MUN80_18560 [Hymenobacter cellulosivorans]
MEISSIDQEVTDFDWYAVDTSGCVIQFASGGGPLPGSVAASIEALTQLHDYFLSLSTETTTARLNPHLAQVVRNIVGKDEDAYRRYAHSFLNYGKRGLFAFDKTDLAHAENRYHLVAYPETPLYAGGTATGYKRVDFPYLCAVCHFRGGDSGCR